MKTRFWLSAVLATTALIWAGCSRETSVPVETANGLTPITVQLDWVAEPEHGGFYQAQADGLFEAAGLEVTLIQGGPNAFATQKAASGQVQFAQADSTNTILAINEGLPVTQVAAVFQQNPSVLMLHADNPINSFEELDGKTIMARPEWAFLPYLKAKYEIDFQLIPFNFSVANFIADQNFVQQGFYIAEPFFVEAAGGQKPKFLYAWDAGFDSYVTLVANEAWIAENPEATRAFIAAYIEGWKRYLLGDPTAAHELMKAENSKNSDAFLRYSRQMIIDERLVMGRGPDSGPDKIGRLETGRMTTQIEQLEELEILQPSGKLTPDQVMTADFLP